MGINLKGKLSFINGSAGAGGVLISFIRLNPGFPASSGSNFRAHANWDGLGASAVGQTGQVLGSPAAPWYSFDPVEVVQ